METQLDNVLVTKDSGEMLKGSLGFGLDQAFDGFGVFKADPYALGFADFTWGKSWFSDNLELVVVITLEGRNNFLPAGTDFEHVLVVDLEEDGEQLLFVR